MVVAKNVAANRVNEAAVALEERGERSFIAIGGKLLQQLAIGVLRIGLSEFAKRL